MDVPALFLFQLFVHCQFLANIEALLCDEAFSCFNTSVDGTSIYAQGYKSVAQSEVDGTNFYAYGAFGGYETSNIAVVSVSSNADNGVSYASTNIGASTEIACYGASSCSHATLQSDATVESTFLCWGQQSCSNTRLKEVKRIEGHGSYSLLNSIIDATSDGSTTIDLYGYNAGYNLTIKTTEAGQNLFINCAGNGCNGTMFDCDALSSCTITCNQATACPVNISATPEDAPGPVDFEFNSDILSINFDNMCSNVSNESGNDYNPNPKYVFDDEYDPNSTATVVANGTYFCCRGSYACPNMLNVSVINSNAIISGYYGFDGFGRVLRMIDTFDSNTVGIGTGFNGQIYCSGESSCKNAILYTWNTIYCMAHESCHSSTFYDAHSVYCTGYERSCEATKMIGVSNIYIGARQAAIDSFIYSDSNSMIMNVYLMSYRAGYGVTIYCNLTDICNVYCTTVGACESTLLVCYNISNCNDGGYCDTEIGIECPQIRIVTDSPTPMPSGIPSDINLNATHEPTSIPTSIPTNTPTNVPSSNPGLTPTTPMYNPTTIPVKDTIGISTTTLTTIATVEDTSESTISESTFPNTTNVVELNSTGTNLFVWFPLFSILFFAFLDQH